MSFSVLMSLYYKESAACLNECLKSIYDQTANATEIVIVEDGPLTPELHEVIELWQSKLPIETVNLDVNVGLGKALNEGLKHCKFDIVARMDTDDICHPQRFEKQLHVMKSAQIDVCGSWVSEFDKIPTNYTALRMVEQEHGDIIRLSRFRNPMNHPTVMYQKSAILDVGGYDDVLYFEDYHLWLKLIKRGYKFYNIQEPLVAMRAGIGQLSRRGGFRYAILEIDFFKRSSREGIMTKLDAFKNILTRFPLRILPTRVLGMLYKIIRNKGVIT